MEPDDLTQEELDAILRELTHHFESLPTDHAGIWWVASTEQGNRLGSATAQESLGLDGRGRVHWCWWHGESGFEPTYKGSGWFPATPALAKLCRLPETWGRFVARLRRWRDERGRTFSTEETDDV